MSLTTMLIFSVWISAIIGFLVWMVVSDKRAKNSPYKEIARGIYDYTEYASEGGKYGGEVTVIYFEDGQTCLMHGFKEIKVQKGDRIKILRNDWERGDKVEKY